MRRFAHLLLVVLALWASPPPATAQKEPLVVSVWGGNWKDTVEKVVEHKRAPRQVTLHIEDAAQPGES